MTTDLEANRSGHITLRQRFRLLRGVAALLFMTGIGLVIVIALAPYLLHAFGDLGVFGGVVVLLFFLMCLGMTLIGAFGLVMVLGDLIVGRVSTITGVPTIRREAVRTNAVARPLPSSFTYPGQYKYKVMVGDREFDIDRRVADQLSRDGRHVRVYYAAWSGELLSLEPLTAPADA